MIEPPGSRWNYNSAAVHLLAAAIDVNAGGTAAFADRYLLEPLGIRSRDWEIDNRGIQASTTRRLMTGTRLGALGTLGYGDLWWLGRAGTTDVVLAWGHGGQYVYIVPALELVVVTTPPGSVSAPGPARRWPRSPM